MKKTYKDITSWLCELGFEYDRTNSKQVDFFTHTTHGEVSVAPGIDERQARALKKRIQRDFGLATAKDQSKRSALAVKERHAGDREKAHAQVVRLDAIRDEIAREQEAAQRRTFHGLADQCSPSELAAIRRRMEENERELAYWRSLMTELPAPRERNAQHRA